MAYRQIIVVTDDASLATTLRRELERHLDSRSPLGVADRIITNPTTKLVSLASRSFEDQSSALVIVDIRESGPSAVLPENVSEGGGSFFIAMSMLPETPVLALATPRIVARLRETLLAYDPLAFSAVERLFVASPGDLGDAISAIEEESPFIFDPEARRSMLRDVVTFGLTSVRRRAETRALRREEIFVVEDDRLTALSLAVAFYLRDRPTAVIDTFASLEAAARTRRARPMHDAPRAAKLALVDFELAFPDLTAAASLSSESFLSAQDAIAILFGKEEPFPSIYVVTGSKGEQHTAAKELCNRAGYKLIPKPFESAESVVRDAARDVLSRLTGDPVSMPVRRRHSAPRSLILIVEAMLQRARKLSASTNPDDLVAATVISADALDLLRYERSSAIVEALQIQEKCSLQLELAALGSDAQIKPADRIARIDEQLGTAKGATPAFGMNELETQNVRLRLFLTLRRIYAAGDQVLGTDASMREIGRTNRKLLAKSIKSQANLGSKFRAWRNLSFAWYFEMCTDNGLSITRLLSVTAVWWLTMSVFFMATFVSAGDDWANAFVVGLQHSGASLLAYPGSSGLDHYLLDAARPQVARNLHVDCVLLVPDCHANPGTVYAFGTALARLLSFLHLGLIASILFRKVMYRTS